MCETSMMPLRVAGGGGTARRRTVHAHVGWRQRALDWWSRNLEYGGNQRRIDRRDRLRRGGDEGKRLRVQPWLAALDDRIDLWTRSRARVVLVRR